MYFSYIFSVIILSLAIYGAWLLVKDIWTLFLQPEIVEMPSASFLIVVKNAEHEIEDLIRRLMREIERAGTDCDVVVVDNHSYDLTPAILRRLEEELGLTVLTAPASLRPAADALPLCRGAVVHVLELGTRLSSEECMMAVCTLLRQDGREIMLVRGGS